MSISFSALLLAGGQSQRMGRDKAWLEIAGEPLWRRQLTLLESLAPERIFIAAPVHPEWLCPRCEFVADARSGAGPLAGLVAGLRACTSQFLLALAVDLPSMSAIFLRDLLGQCTPGRGVIPV
ncbi:MAG: molybdenum cofactor guanylyltransferase, partial [Chthoniobacterales bacterium]